MSCTCFPMCSSPMATFEVVGNTGKMSSEKAGVGDSTPSLATKSLIFNNLPLNLNPIHRVDIL